MQNNKDGFQYFILAFSQFEYTPTLIQYPSQRLWFFCLTPKNPFLLGKLECNSLLATAFTLFTPPGTIKEVECMSTNQTRTNIFRFCFSFNFPRALGFWSQLTKNKNMDSGDEVDIYYKITKTNSNIIELVLITRQ